MPKHEAGTPKAIANKIKSKGLQKLRWYCQMCQKQCRDENGFKCHLTSESHQRQLLLFAEKPNQFVGTYSEEFLQGFMDTLRRGYGTKRVKANNVYQEYIKDKEHVHMNSTKWLTLTGFVQWLGKAGKAKVDHTEKGWFIAYIDREEEERKEKKEKKNKMDQDDETRMQQLILAQAQRDKERAESSGTLHSSVYTELQRDETAPGAKVEFSMGKAAPAAVAPPPAAGALRGGQSSTRDSRAGDEGGCRAGDKEKRREAANRRDNWLHAGIAVKVVTKRLGEKYYKKKGTVVDLVDDYCAHVKMHDSGDLLKLDQSHVETVIPALGRLVLVTNGAYRNNVATLDRLNEETFSAELTIHRGPLKGRRLPRVQYEDFSKLVE